MLTGDLLNFIFLDDVFVLVLGLIWLVAQQNRVLDQFVGGLLSQVNEPFKFTDAHGRKGDFGMGLFGDELHAVSVFVLVGLDEILRVDINVTTRPQQ